MKRSTDFSHILRRIAAAALCLCLLIPSACSKNDDTGINTRKGVETRNEVTLPSPDNSVHYAQSEEAFTVKAASSGFIDMKIDPKSNSFCIHESSKNKIWTALPLLSGVAQGEELTSNASAVAVTVNGGTDIYTLNSQDNSLAYGKASYKLTDNGAQFIYDIFPDDKTAAKESLGKDDIGFRVILTASLVDGSMLVDCTWSNLTGNPNACIETVEVLNGFGSFNDSHEDDFLLVPDGCGAIIRTAIFDESFEPLSFAVYGSDPSTGNVSDGDALIPAFGIKHGDSAFAALVQQGDAVANINADKAKTVSEYNKVYPSFTVTPALYKDKTLYTSESASVEKISLCYRFLSGKNATYAGLASACREQLIRNSVLSTKNVDPESYLPFFLTLTGASKKSFGPIKYLKKLTTFEQAQDMLVRMKNKGINNVSLRYTGVFDGGLDSADIESSSLLSRLGGTDKLSALYSYASAQKMNLYLDINLVSSAKGFGSGNATALDKKDTEITPRSPLREFMAGGAAQRKLRKLSELADVVAKILRDTKGYGFSGYCINDAGSLLYSDFSHGGLLREDASIAISKAVAPITTGYSTMAATGNFYMLKNVDSLVNIPLSSNASESGAYVTVPFIQLVLHGIVDYAGEAINTSINSDEILLRCIEYGACPHYQWNYVAAGSAPENDPFFYDNTINSAAEFYSEANETLNDLRDARMTDHYQVANGVFCTEYDTGSMIYVNYTDSDYTVLGAVVEARSYIRIN